MKFCTGCSNGGREAWTKQPQTVRTLSGVSNETYGLERLRFSAAHVSLFLAPDAARLGVFGCYGGRYARYALYDMVCIGVTPCEHARLGHSPGVRRRHRSRDVRRTWPRRKWPGQTTKRSKNENFCWCDTHQLTQLGEPILSDGSSSTRSILPPYFLLQLMISRSDLRIKHRLMV